MEPLGGAFFDKRLGALSLVGAAEGQAESTLLIEQTFGFGHRERRAERGLRLAQREARFAGEFLGERPRFRHKLLGRNYLVGESPFVGGFGVDHVAGHDQLACARLADSMGQALGTAETGDQTKIDLRLPEARFLARHNQVAGEGDLGAAAEGETVDRGDHGDRQILERRGHAMAEAAEFHAVNHRHLRHRRDIGAGDKGAVARAGNDKDANRAIVADVAQHLGHLLDHGRIQRVQRLRTVDRHGGDFALIEQ